MSSLSAIPKTVVAAMQIALVALLLLTVLPMATGGLSIDVDDSTSMEYDEDTHTFTMRMSVNIDADLTFDITGFRADIWMTSGGNTFIVYESDIMTIPKKSSAEYTFYAEIPLTTVMMMMLGSLDHGNSVITVNIYASTLGGMISVAASVNIPIVDGGSPIVINDKEISENRLTAEFILPKNGMIDTLLESMPSAALSGSIGNADFDLTIKSENEAYHVDLSISAAASLMYAVKDAPRNELGGINVNYGGGNIMLTAEQTDLITGVLGMLYERWPQ
ncbi:MAG: hypothetical protein FWD92_00695 [Methanomassiliicoccaceae archaeon]|nr:hypothetical protein [Methanomassiliicoccaceae archaeon]